MFDTSMYDGPHIPDIDDSFLHYDDMYMDGAFGYTEEAGTPDTAVLEADKDLGVGEEMEEPELPPAAEGAAKIAVAAETEATMSTEDEPSAQPRTADSRGPQDPPPP